MNSIISFVAFANISLIFTNIWIRLYTFLIPYLDFLFPPAVKADFYRPQAAFPEPFEIKLYLVLTILFTVGLFFLRSIVKNLVTLQKRYYMMSLLLFPALLFIFVLRLGQFPLLHDLYPYSKELYRNLYGIVFFLYLIFVIVFIAEINIIIRFFRKQNSVRFLVYGLVFIVSCIITFEPTFPITSLNYAFFYGPAWEIAQGKTIFTQIPSQYGFLSILVLAFLQKIGINILFLPVALWILTATQYFICFYLIYKISSSVSLSLLGFFSVITVNYLTYIQSPQSGPLRWLPMILLLFVLYKQKSVASNVFIFILSLLSFWIIDVGIYILLSYMATIGLSYLLKKISFRKALGTICFLLFSVVLIFTLINIVHILLGMQAVDAGAIFRSIIKHANSGLVMIPIPQKTYFWLVMLVYFASIIYVFKKETKLSGGGSGRDAHLPRSKAGSAEERKLDTMFSGSSGRARFTAHLPSRTKQISSLSDEYWRGGNFRQDLTELFLFSANLSLFAGIYYVGRSAPDYLFKISTIVLLTLFLVLAENYKTIQKTNLKYFFLAIIFILFVVIPAWGRKTYLSETLIKKYQDILSGQFAKPAYIDQYKNFYKDETSLIRKHLTTQEVAILSTDDTYLFYLTGKKNLLDANPQVGLDTRGEMTQFTTRLRKTCPQAIVVDCSVIGKCPIYSTLTQGFNVVPYILNDLEEACKTHYQPILCTNKLCIVENKK